MSTSQTPRRPPAPPADVTITADAFLQQNVTAFVNEIAGSYLDAEGLARWLEPACPLVSGLPQKEGEFVLARVSEIARTAGVPLAGENCKPNLYILLTDDPPTLLRGMEKRNHAFTFAKAPPQTIEEFIATPRPVRVWYHTSSRTPEGLPLTSLSWPQIDQLVDKFDKKYDAMSNQEPVIAGGTNTWSQATHLSFNAILDIYRVFEIVDTRQLQGISLGQVADYVAFSGLAQLVSKPRVGEAPTILKLFDGKPEAPAGMSNWDRSFLKSLYVTEQKSKLQRSQIAGEMQREMLAR